MTDDTIGKIKSTDKNTKLHARSPDLRQEITECVILWIFFNTSVVIPTSDIKGTLLSHTCIKNG